MRYLFSFAIACLLLSAAVSDLQAQFIYYRSRPVMTAGPGSNIYYPPSYRPGGFSYGYTIPYRSAATITRFPTSITSYVPVTSNFTAPKYRTATRIRPAAGNFQYTGTVTAPRMRPDRYAHTIKSAAFGSATEQRVQTHRPAYIVVPGCLPYPY